MTRLRWFGSMLVLIATMAQACPIVTHGYGYQSYPTYNQPYYQPYYQPTYYPTYTPVYTAVFTPLLTVAVPTAAVGYSPPTVSAALGSGLSSTAGATQPAAPAVTPHQATTGPSPCEQRVAKLEAEVAEMRAFMAGKASVQAPSSSTQEPPGPRDTTNGPSALSIFTNKCAACHGGNLADKDLDGAFRLLKPDGSVANMDGRLLAKLSGKVYTGKMPPPDNKKGIPSLTDQEVGVIMQWVNSTAK